MYSEKLEGLIEAIIADGGIEESEMLVLKKAAIKEGEDPDELEIVVKGRLAKMQKTEGTLKPAAAAPQSNKFGGPVTKCPNCGAPHIAGQASCPECGYAFSGIEATRSAEKLYNMLQQFNDKNRTEVKNVADSTPDMGLKDVLNPFAMMKASQSMMNMRKGDDDGLKDITRRKMDVIKDFPVPNAREDLLDFITSLQPKSNPKGPKTGYETKHTMSSYSGKEYNEDLSFAYWLLFCNCINKAQVSFHSDPDFQRFFSWYEEQKAMPEEKTGLGKLFGRKK